MSPAAGNREPYEKALEPVPPQPATPGKSAKVWADPATRLYRCSSDTSKAKPAKAESLSEADAKARGYMRDGDKACF